jgi:hypothetical protein
MDVGPAFPADVQTAEAVEPGEGSLGHPPVSACGTAGQLGKRDLVQPLPEAGPDRQPSATESDRPGSPGQRAVGRSLYLPRERPDSSSYFVTSADS